MESAPFPVAAPAAKPQLFSLIVLCVQNRCHLEDTLPNSVRSMSFSLGRLQTTASVCWLWGNPPRELCFSDAGVFWIIANLTLATQSHLFQEKFHGSGIGVFWSTANSLAPADQIDNNRFFIQSITMSGSHSLWGPLRFLSEASQTRPLFSPR